MHLRLTLSALSAFAMITAAASAQPLRALAARPHPFAIITAQASAQPAAPAAEPTRVYLANDDHTDFMWTADADTYHRVFVEMFDFHLKLADETAANPSPYRARFNADGSLWLAAYEQRKSPAEFARLIARIKDGTISVPLNTLVSCFGGQPVEAVLRGLYYAGRIERAHDLRFPLAIAMENQTLPLGLASLFAGSGARYSWRGVCACASRLTKPVLGERTREVYWYTGPDGRKLLLKWYSFGAHNIGGYVEAGEPLDALRYIAADAGFLRRHVDPVTWQPYRVFGLFGFGGDDLARKTGVTPPPEVPGVPGLHKVVSGPYCEHFHVIAQRESTRERQVVVSNQLDYFADFERTHGATLPTKTVTYGNEWDLYSASMSETSARAKRAVEKLRTAELLATLVSLKFPDFMRRHAAARDRAFTDIGLFWEHNWTADGPVSRPQRAAWQDQLVAAQTVTAQTVPVSTGEPSVPPRSEVERKTDGATAAIVLNPFIVATEQDTGYQAQSTLAGTRLNTPVKDIGASVFIYTKDFLNGIGALFQSFGYGAIFAVLGLLYPLAAVIL